VEVETVPEPGDQVLPAVTEPKVESVEPYAEPYAEPIAVPYKSKKKKYKDY